MRDFLKQTFASFLGVVLFASLSFGGLVALILAVAVSSKETEPLVERQSILEFDLSTEITDANAELDPSQILSGRLAGESISTPLPLRRVMAAIEEAATDDRVVGIYLHGDINPASSIGFAGWSEIRQALQTFAESGKPIIAYSLGGGERELYLSSVAETIVMNPSGTLEINGFSSESPYFAAALEKFGIGVQVIRVGQYKSAVEPFIRNDRSPQETEQTQQLLSDLWTEFIDTIAESRKVTPAQLQAIADNQGLLMPDEAQKAGLIDRVAYFDEVLPDLYKLTGETEPSNDVEDEESFRQVSLSEYVDAVDTTPSVFNNGNQVALVYAEGDIVSGEGGPGQVGGDRLAKQLRELRLDDNVKAVVLRVNSPGGSAAASERAMREVMLTDQEKPVIVSMGSLAASGGYEISTYARTIFASPTTITGSIGVFGLLPNIQALTNRNGITWDVVKTAKLADGYSLTRPKTPEELAIAQRMVDHLYNQFVTTVSESRELPLAKVQEIAQGRVWSGLDAQQLGLVDELGGLEDAIAAAAEAAQLGDDWQLVEYPKRLSFEEQLVNSLVGDDDSQSAAPTDPISLLMQRFEADLRSLRSLNDPSGIYSRLPFNLHID